MRLARLLLALAFCLPVSAALAQTGKIAGTVTDAATGEALPGVNVVIDGTTTGAVTDVDGYYAIINVRPGTYTLRATFVGFTPAVTEGVRVNIDLTSEVDFALQDATVGLNEIVINAERPVVQRDVSSSMANLSAEEIENLPVTDIEQVIGLQAGFERGLTVRGEGGSQVNFMVDGLSMASGRDNTSFTGVSYTAVQEVQVQTGGFNAEYGNVRSGLVNVVTKEPEGNRFTVDAIVRYSPAGQSNFAGVDVEGNEVDNADSEGSFYLRPMFDPTTAMKGTGEWPAWKANQYQTWPGWESYATSYNAANKTNFTPQELQQVFRQHYLRKDLEVTNPNYEVDATIGGPVPGLHSLLGDLRFLASYRQTQNAYEMAGFARDAFVERMGQGKLVSNIAKGMKLSINGLFSRQAGLNRSEQGDPNLVTGQLPTYPWDGDAASPSMLTALGQAFEANEERNYGEIFGNVAFNLMDIDRYMVGGQFTHTLSPTTFYEVQLQNIGTKYDTRAVAGRDTARAFSYLDGRLRLDEEPFGFTSKDRQDPFGIGFITAGHWGSGYDRSAVNRVSGRFDLTSQLSRFSLVKTGVEYIHTNYDVDYGENDPEHPHNGDPKWLWNRSPQQAAAYLQNKLEFKGMVANLGVRLDYFHAGGDWYVFDTYDRAFAAAVGVDKIDEVLEQEPTDHQISFSPRLGVSFPVTDDSKLYFNYGHFRQMLDPMRLFEIREFFTGAVRGIGNPNHPMPKTVAYELGFEQNIANQFLLRLAGYYRDLSNQPREVQYLSLDDLVDYRMAQPWNYSDVRGFEVTLQKNQGKWIRGFLNYTYMVRKTGNFGFSRFDENTTAMREFVETRTEHYANQPMPEPYARFNIEVLMPEDFGPKVAGISPLADWRINFLGEWRLGQAFTWDGQSLTSTNTPITGNNRDLFGNVRWNDYYMLDMRLSKNFDTRVGRAQFFVDFNNVFNLRHMYLGAGNLFRDGNQDLQRYMSSLQLPEDTFPEGNANNSTRIVGDDQPGTYRKAGVEFVPIIIGTRPASGQDTHPLYYEPGANGAEGKYYQWNGTAWVDADPGRVKDVLDDKAYIDMPNRTFSQFLNPRNVFFGLRLSF